MNPMIKHVRTPHRRLVSGNGERAQQRHTRGMPPHASPDLAKSAHPTLSLEFSSWPVRRRGQLVRRVIRQ
jgi:hypothetical protein